MPADHHALLSTQGSERATTGPGNNIVTRAGKTHVVWQDSDAGGYWAKARTLDHARGAWSATATIGPGTDNHARPCITIDSKGFLHVVIGGHGTTVNYYRSKSPDDSSAWTEPEALAPGTYPMIICGGDDTLALTYRDKKLAGIELFVRPPGPDGKWESRGFVFAKAPKYNNGYGGYNGAMAWGRDGKTIHFTTDVYEGVDFYKNRGTHQAVTYAKSDDLGATWKKADGTPLEKSPLPDKMDVIARNYAGDDGASMRPMLRNGGVVADDHGNPFVYLTQVIDDIGRPRLVTPDGKGGWRDLPLVQAVNARWPGMEVRDARGHISRTTDGAIHVVVMLAPPKPPVPLGPKASSIIEGVVPNFGVGLVTTRDGGATFETREVLPYVPDAERHQASIERPSGSQDLAGLPSIIWTVGENRYPEKNEVIDTKVWWTQLKS